MKYLFIDIECSNSFGGIPKMIEFGYVLANESLEVIKKGEILMSPGKGRQNRFDRKIFERDPSFRFAYDEDTYFSSEEFPHHYEIIKTLVEDKDTVVVGWAVNNDIGYLNKSCERYGLEKLRFVSYDIFEYSKEYKSQHEIHKKGLDGIFESMYGNPSLMNLSPHFSRDDAHMTLLVYKKLSELSGKTLSDFEKDFPRSKRVSTDEPEHREHSRSSSKRKINEYKNTIPNFFKLNEELNNIFKQSFEEKTKGIHSFSLSCNLKMKVDTAVELAKEIIAANCSVKRNLNAEYLVYLNEEDRIELEQKIDTSLIKLITITETREIIRDL